MATTQSGPNASSNQRSSAPPGDSFARGPTDGSSSGIDPSLADLDLERPTMVVVAHPDDEAIGAGALLSEMFEPTVVMVTDGAPWDMRFANRAGFQTRESYAKARHLEFLHAMAVVGIRVDQTVQLRVPDQDACF